MKSMKKIGVIGGSGPESTIYFYNGLIKYLQKERGAKYNFDFPYIHIINVPFFDTVVGENFDAEKIKKDLIKATILLENLSDFIVIPCNTMHIHYDELVKYSSVPILNIIEETVKRIPKNLQKVLLFATEPTVNSNMYQCRKTIITPRNQKNINRIIHNLMGGKILPEDKDFLHSEIDKTNCDGCILGCTELPILFNEMIPRVPIFDSTNILIEETIKFAEER